LTIGGIYRDRILRTPSGFAHRAPAA
jgi:hypothetical protein